MGANVGLQQGNVVRLELARQLPQLAKLFGVDPDDGALLKGLEIEFAQLHARHGRQLCFHRGAEPGFDKGHRRLRSQQHFQRPGVRGQPVFDFGAIRRVPPAAGKDETLLMDGHDWH